MDDVIFNGFKDDLSFFLLIYHFNKPLHRVSSNVIAGDLDEFSRKGLQDGQSLFTCEVKEELLAEIITILVHHEFSKMVLNIVNNGSESGDWSFLD